MPHCIKHTYHLVNNRYYLTGEPVPSGADYDDDSEWRTEKKCEVCGELFPEVEANKLKIQCEK